MTEAGFPRMVHNYYVKKLRVLAQERRERIAALRDRADAEGYVRSVRKKVLACFAPMPARSPLNAAVGTRQSCPRFDVEPVIFESRPGFLVTGSLYIPKGAGRGDRRPAVMGLCGHSGEGKSYALYQSFSQGLAAKGFVVFMIDPISQGERRQFYPRDGGKRPGLCHAHNLMGNQQVLVDDFFGSWRVWDAIRGLDYLLTRPEVDATRVGVTGNSGGGTLATYLTALDPRLTMAAPSCFVCSYLANVENELPADAEQNPPGILKAGLDEADMLLSYAPRPTLVLAKYNDFFDERAARVAAEDVRRVNALMGGRPGDTDCFVGPGDHGFSLENREAMYGFFLKHAGMKGSTKEAHVTPLDAAALNATPRGETFKVGSRRVFDFTTERVNELAEARRELDERELVGAAGELLAIPQTKGAPHYRIRPSGHTSDKGVRFRARFQVETEDGILCLATSYGAEHPTMHPPTGKVLLYVGDTSADKDVLSVPAVRRLANGTRPFVTVDPRGIGASMPGTCGGGPFNAPYGADYLYAATGEMLGESYLGRRVFDVLRTIDWLLAGGATEVRLMGRGRGSVVVTFAALLHRSKPSLKLIDYLPSYELLATTPQQAWPLSTLLRGCLVHFDLPDIYRLLGRRVVKSQPWDALMRPAKRRTKKG